MMARPMFQLSKNGDHYNRSGCYWRDFITKQTCATAAHVCLSVEKRPEFVRASFFFEEMLLQSWYMGRIARTKRMVIMGGKLYTNLEKVLYRP